MQEQIINNLQIKSWRKMRLKIYAAKQCCYKESKKSEVMKNPVSTVDPGFSLYK